MLHLKFSVQITPILRIIIIGIQFNFFCESDANIIQADISSDQLHIYEGCRSHLLYIIDYILFSKHKYLICLKYILDY